MSRAKRRGGGRERRKRRLRLETLEDRRLLTTLAHRAQVAEIERAFDRVSDLSTYSTAELDDAREWVLSLAPGAHPGSVAAELGVHRLEPSELLPHIYHFTVPESNGPSTVVADLNGIDEIESFYPLVETKRTPRLIPDDPRFPSQWHLRNSGQSGGTIGIDANLESAWDIVTGAGVTIGIVDTGLERTHEDLRDKYQASLSFDFNNNDNDPDDCQGHGTSVAGVSAASTNNGLGVAGAAPEALLAGLKLICGGLSDQVESDALGHMPQAIDISNNSWGPVDAVDWLAAPGPLTTAALQNGVNNGRGGLGTIYVWAGGNGAQGQDNVNYDGYASSRYTIAVGALDHNGRRSSYSEPGASLLVSAHSSGGGASVTTTALNNGYTNGFGGTSSAAPLVSGVVALMLEANSALTWRDVQHILVNSARMTDASEPGWFTNAAGHAFNHQYGFGVVDAAAAVGLARGWNSVPAERFAMSGRFPVGAAIPDNDAAGLTSTVTVDETFLVETVDVVFTAPHADWDDLEVALVSPSGTRAVLAETHDTSGDSSQFNAWQFNATAFWDEPVTGDWTLEVKDLAGGNTGTFDAWELIAYGYEPVDDPTPPPSAGATSVRGMKWADLNANGVRDAGEPAIADVFVYADLDGDDKIDLGEPAVLTGTDGRYDLRVLPGTYTIREVVQPGWEQTFPAGGEHEVEVLEHQAVLDINFGNTASRDYGDAPLPYPTRELVDGPSHGVLRGLQLGQLVDGEGDGRPSDGADGDDNFVLDDDDGIRFPNPIASERPGEVIVTVSTGGYSPASLQGWIDFNRDGDWDDLGEQIFLNRRLGDGEHQLAFQVPPTTVAGPTVARFRYGYEPNLGPTGPSFVGEVEDHTVMVLADDPVANDDAFVVPQDSVNQSLDVLANDFPSSQGSLRIVETSLPSAGGFIAISPDGSSLFYTPARNFFSPPDETFTYTVDDGSGNRATANVQIEVQPTFTDPIAVDDTFEVNPGSADVALDVLRNDVAGTGGSLTLLAVSAPASGTAEVDTRGTASLEDDVVRYTPDPSFQILDQFTYTVSNAAGVLSTATVTIQAVPKPLNGEVLLVLETLDLDGNPIEQVEAGDEFWLQISAKDNRFFPPNPQGVAAIYLDVLYDRDLASVVADPQNPLGFDVQFSSAYGEILSGDATVSGIIEEVGAFQSGLDPLGPDPLEVLRIRFHAEEAGELQFFADPADDRPAHDVLLFDPPAVVPLNRIHFGTASLDIDAGSGRGNAGDDDGEEPAPDDPGGGGPPTLNFDVNRDGFISPIDALLIINDLNQQGTHPVEGEGEGDDPDTPLDVNQDGMVSPLDVLLVINELNRRSGGDAEGEAPLLDDGLADDRDTPSTLASPDNAPGNLELPVGQAAEESPTRPFASDEDEEDWEDLIELIAEQHPDASDDGPLA